MLKLIPLLLSVSFWNQFVSVPTWSHLEASTVLNKNPRNYDCNDKQIETLLQLSDILYICCSVNEVNCWIALGQLLMKKQGEECSRTFVLVGFTSQLQVKIQFVCFNFKIYSNIHLIVYIPSFTFTSWKELLLVI